MQRAEREARLERAKELGRIAYVILRSSEIEGMLEYDGQEKHLRTIEEDGLILEMLEPFRSDADPSEFSRIVIRKGGHRVLQIQWSKSGDFTLVFFEPGDWEWTVREWPPPIPFEV
jgi:hypothetical protein